MISDKRTSGLLGQLGNIKNDEEFEKYFCEDGIKKVEQKSLSEL